VGELASVVVLACSCGGEVAADLETGLSSGWGVWGGEGFGRVAASAATATRVEGHDQPL